MRSSPLLLFGASGTLAANYTEHSRTPYNASASTATALAHSAGSAPGYTFLNTAPTTLRTSVLPVLSANWTASVSAYGAKGHQTETSMVASSASPARLAATNYSLAANVSVAATHAPAPSALNATVLTTVASTSPPAPVYTASPRTNRTAVANGTAAAHYAAAAYTGVSVVAASASSSAPAHPSAWPLASLSMPANGSSGIPWAASHRRPHVSVPSNATHSSSLAHNSSSSPAPLAANGTSGASLASPPRRPYVFLPHNATHNSSSSLRLPSSATVTQSVKV